MYVCNWCWSWKNLWHSPKDNGLVIFGGWYSLEHSIMLWLCLSFQHSMCFSIRILPSLTGTVIETLKCVAWFHPLPPVLVPFNSFLLTQAHKRRNIQPALWNSNLPQRFQEDQTINMYNRYRLAVQCGIKVSKKFTILQGNRKATKPLTSQQILFRMG